MSFAKRSREYRVAACLAQRFKLSIRSRWSAKVAIAAAIAVGSSGGTQMPAPH